MKRIHIIRHAKSDWSVAGQRDFDRVLNERGLSNAPMMAARFAKKYRKPDFIVCSPAKRTHDTCVFFCEALGFDFKDVFFEKKIYEAPLLNLVQVIGDIPDHANEALFIGHNYGVGLLVEYLTGEQVAMPTCAIATVDLHIDRWQEVGKDSGTLLEYDFPKNDSL